jgi:hypothetical protein
MTEERLNRLLRQVDWRFLLHQTEVPRRADLPREATSEALELVTRVGDGLDEADLVVLGFPSRVSAASARRALRSGGEVACLWRAPRPGGIRRARAHLRRAGFSAIHFYRPGLQPGETEAWLPLDKPAIAARASSERPPRSRREAILRRAWRLLGPVCAIARVPGADPNDGGRELPDPDAWVLLTGGAESDAKVVGLPFFEEGTGSGVVAKFARTAKAEAALEREASFLADLERERPALGGVPRLCASGRRAGQVGIVQDAVVGKPLNALASPSEFASLAPKVTRWLLALAGDADPQPAAIWSGRLVSDPLDELERDFAGLVPADLPGRARRALASLGDLPLSWEHRDFGPWNVVISERGDLAVIDWEDAEPRGLPGLDLVYFLASAGFALDGVRSDEIDRASESNRRLLDPGTDPGGVATACVEQYRAALGIGEKDFQRLRLLCWIVQSLIACRRLVGGAAEGAPAASDADLFIHLAEDELRALEDMV